MSGQQPQEVSALEREKIEKLGETATKIRRELDKKIVGMTDVIDKLMMALFSGGHCLLVGVPGLAKTLLISSLSEILSLKFKRIQFTPDLMPSDITGTEIIAQNAETGERLSAGPVPVTTLRAGMVVGPRSAAFETIRALVDRLPAMICPRWVSTPTQPIALGDVVVYLAAVCGLEPAYGESFDVGGPEVMTYRQMIERIARIRGKRMPIVEVPVLTPRLSSWWLHLVTPVNASVARPLVEGLRTPTVALDERIRDLVPLEPTPFDDAVRSALAR